MSFLGSIGTSLATAALGSIFGGGGGTDEQGRSFVQQPPDFGLILKNIEDAAETATTEEARQMYAAERSPEVAEARRKYDAIRQQAINHVPGGQEAILAQIAQEAYQYIG